jgi:hypothetical protein
MKRSSFGVQFQVGDGEDPEVFTTIAGVGDIAGPGWARETDDVTAHDSPGGFREFVSTVRDGGEITFPLRWDPSDPTQDILEGLKNVNEPTRIRLVYPMIPPDGMYQEFSGWLTNASRSAPVAGHLAADVTIKVTGDFSDLTAVTP